MPALWRFLKEPKQEDLTTIRYGHYLFLALMIHELLMSCCPGKCCTKWCSSKEKEGEEKKDQ